MTAELLYTSAPKGLRPGSRGFCTVISSSGMPTNLASKLESISGYRQMFPPNSPEAGRNPIAYSHLTFSMGGQSTSVLSRVAAYGADYSGRTNKLAHHVVPSVSEKSSAGPAWTLMQPGLMRDSWDGNCQTTAAGPMIPNGSVNAGLCANWQRLAGDAGWGGVVANAFHVGRGKPLWVVYPLEQQAQLLSLLNEAIALLRPEFRWKATFSTYAGQLSPDINCQVRCVVEGSQDARMAAARGTVIQLGSDNGAVPSSDLVDLARGKTPAPSLSAPVAPAATPVANPAGPAAVPSAPSVPAAVAPSVPVTPRGKSPALPNTPALPTARAGWGNDDFDLAPAMPSPGAAGQPDYQMVGNDVKEDSWVNPGARRSRNTLPWIMVAVAAMLLFIVLGAAGALLIPGSPFAMNQAGQDPPATNPENEPVEAEDVSANEQEPAQNSQLKQGQDATKDPSDANEGVVNDGNNNSRATPPSTARNSEQSGTEQRGDQGMLSNGDTSEEEPFPLKPTLALKEGTNGYIVKVTGLATGDDFLITTSGHAKVNATSGIEQTPEPNNDSPEDKLLQWDGVGEIEFSLNHKLAGEVPLGERRIVVKLYEGKKPIDPPLVEKFAVFKPNKKLITNDLSRIINSKPSIKKDGAGLAENTPVKLDLTDLSGWDSERMSAKAWVSESVLGEPEANDKFDEDCYLLQDQAVKVSVLDNTVTLENITSDLALARSMNVDLYFEIYENNETIYESDPLKLKLADESASMFFYTDFHMPDLDSGWRHAVLLDDKSTATAHVVRDKGKGRSGVVFGTNRYPPPILKENLKLTDYIIKRVDSGNNSTPTKFTIENEKSYVLSRPNVDPNYWQVDLEKRRGTHFKKQIFTAFQLRNSQQPVRSEEGFSYGLKRDSLKNLFGDREYDIRVGKLAHVKQPQLVDKFKDENTRRTHELLTWLWPPKPKVSAWRSLGLALHQQRKPEVWVFATIEDSRLAGKARVKDGDFPPLKLSLNEMTPQDFRYGGGKWTSSKDPQFTIKPILNDKILLGFTVFEQQDFNSDKEFKDSFEKLKDWYDDFEKWHKELDKDLDAGELELHKAMKDAQENFSEAIVYANTANVKKDFFDPKPPSFLESRDVISKSFAGAVDSFAVNGYSKVDPGKKPELSEDASVKEQEEHEKALKRWKDKDSDFKNWVKLKGDIGKKVLEPDQTVKKLLEMMDADKVSIEFEEDGTRFEYEIPSGLKLH